MAKRRAPQVIQAAKSTINQPITTHPDAKKDDIGFLLMGLDPFEAYNRETNFFVRREMIWRAYKRSPVMSTIAHSVASEIASQEVIVTPTESNPSASTLMNAKRSVDLINNSMNRPGGVVDFIINIIDGYWGSKSGAFIATPRDMNGNIVSIGIIPPMLPRPYYGWNNQDPIITPDGQQTIIADGIWFVQSATTGGSYYVMPADNYFQMCYGSYAYGAWQDGEPVAEKQLSPIITHISLSDYLRKTISCTDDAQVLVWNNVDSKTLQTRSNEQKDLAFRRRNGLPVNPEDEGNRLSVTGADPDKEAKVHVVNLRAFPEGFDPELALTQYEQRIALGCAVHPRRAAADIQKERFGNAQQSAMMNSDEPGVKGIKTVITSFFNSNVMSGLALRAVFNSRESAENYALVSRDNVIAQSIAQLGDKITNEQAQSYLLRNGFLLPSDVGQQSLRTGDGTPLASGWVSLRDRMGHLITNDNAIYQLGDGLTSGKKSIDPSLEPCAQKALDRWSEWTLTELPTVVTPQGLSYYGLRQEVDDITVEVYHDLIQCSKQKGGRSNDIRVRQVYDAFKAYFYNMIGSPAIRQAFDHNPANNMFDDMWKLASLVYMGGDSTDLASRLQNVATRYAPVISRYANATRAAVYMNQAINNLDAPVTWVLGHTEKHCDMCPQFAGVYQTMKDMLQRTGGLLPGDVRLTCSGNCLCHLEF